tara:strand:- start:152 stop:1186 length:1035 start_codon:yes stop_codon:yes gene_type:complete
MGSTNITYEQPEYEPDTSFKDFLQYEKERAATLDQRAAEEKAARDAAEELRRQTGASGLTDFYDRTAKQLQQGLIGFEGAQLNLQNYMDKYQLDKGFSPQTTTTYTGIADDPDTEVDESKTTTTAEAFLPSYTDPTKGASQYLDKLQDLYSGEGGILGEQREAGVQLAYQDILGRPASPDELSGALSNLGLQAYGSSGMQGLRDSLKNTQEYTNKFNQNYYDNYYDIEFGKQTVDEEGKRTGLRTFQFDSGLLPTYLESEQLKADTGVELPDYAEFFSEARTPQELKEGIQGIRDTRKYLYSAGLTNLQGQIDKETQKIINIGKKDIAQIGKASGMYNLIASAF